MIDLSQNREEACRLESLMLARLEVPAIAARLKMKRSAVSDYRDVFFDVRSQIPDENYIVNWAIRPEANLGASETARERVAMKAVAYFCGVPTLESLFFLGQGDISRCWVDPASLLKRLAAVHIVNGVADLIMGSTSALDSKAFSALVAQLSAVISGAVPEDYPSNPMQWSTWKLEERMSVCP